MLDLVSSLCPSTSTLNPLLSLQAHSDIIGSSTSPFHSEARSFVGGRRQSFKGHFPLMSGYIESEAVFSNDVLRLGCRSQVTVFGVLQIFPQWFIL